MLITHHQLDSLIDLECIILDAVLHRKNYTQIQYELKIRRVDIAWHMLNIYKKLDIWPYKVWTLRTVWAQSLRHERANKKVPATAELPCGLVCGF